MMLMYVSLYIFCVWSLIHVEGRSSANYGSLFKGSSISELDGPTLLKQKLKGDPFLTMFYAPWCPHCQHYAPTWISICDHLPKTRPAVRFFAVNCVLHKVRKWKWNEMRWEDEMVDCEMRWYDMVRWNFKLIWNMYGGFINI